MALIIILARSRATVRDISISLVIQAVVIHFIGPTRKRRGCVSGARKKRDEDNSSHVRSEKFKPGSECARSRHKCAEPGIILDVCNDLQSQPPLESSRGRRFRARRSMRKDGSIDERKLRYPRHMHGAYVSNRIQKTSNIILTELPARMLYILVGYTTYLGFDVASV